MPIHPHPQHIVRAKEAAIAAGLDATVVKQTLDLAAQAYLADSLNTHNPTTEASLRELGILYKYREAHNERHWQVLENQTLYLPNPNSFNDPFDANIGMRYDLLDDDVLLKLIKEHVKAMHPVAGGFLRQKYENQFLAWFKDPVIHEKTMNDWLRHFTSRMRVLCVCPTRDNILLWSHYAYNHEGFAIGFDTTQLCELWKNHGGWQIGNVMYMDDYPILIPPMDDFEAQKDVATTIMNAKSKIWAYEKEVRFTMFDGPEKALFPVELIKEVVLGCKIDKGHQHRMLELIDKQYPHVSVLKAKLARGDFALAFDKLR